MIDLKTIRYQKYIYILWIVLGLWILWQVGTAAARSATLPRRVRNGLVQHTASETKDESESSKNSRASVPGNPFAPPAKFGGLSCSAVLGQEAYINGRLYKIGENVQGAEIIEILPNAVRIRWQDEEHTLVPFNVPVQTSPRSQPSSENNPSDQNSEPRPPDSAPSGRSTRNSRPQGNERPSPEERAEMRRQMRERQGR